MTGELTWQRSEGLSHSVLTRLGTGFAVGWVRGRLGACGGLDPLACESLGPLADVHWGPQGAHWGPQGVRLGPQDVHSDSQGVHLGPQGAR